MTENRKIALDAARALGHADHKQLLQTAADIERYLENGQRPALPQEQRVVRLQVQNAAITDIFNMYHIDIVDEIVGYLKKFSKAVAIPNDPNSQLVFKLETAVDPDGITEVFINGEMKPLSNSKKK